MFGAKFVHGVVQSCIKNCLLAKELQSTWPEKTLP
jgi:hypothetical protein